MEAIIFQSSFIFPCLDLLWNIPHIGFSVGLIGSNFGHPYISLMNLLRMSELWHNILPMHFTAAKTSIPQSSGTARHPPVPWWNPDCTVAIRARKRALTLLQCHPTMDNLINYKRLRSRARRVMRDSKKSSWRAYISSLTHHTSFRDFASVSCSNHYSPTFQLIKVTEESKVLDFSTASSDDYNLPFTLSELKSSLSCAHNTAPGPDHIHNSMLKNLPATALHFLLSLSLQPILA